jgi:hypothetical protein
VGQDVDGNGLIDDGAYLGRVIKLVLEYQSIFEGVIPTGAQRSGGICFSTGTVGFGREAGFSTAPLTASP